jgi:3-oxosteroid 1-dehydrogenase
VRRGHRSLEPEPLRGDALGDAAATLRPLHHMMWLMDRIPIKQVEAQVLMAQLPGWRSLAGQLLWEYVSDFRWWLRHKRSRRLTNGAAGIARLRWSMLDRNLPLWLETSLVSLIVDGDRVTGAVIERAGRRERVRTRRGVLLAAGGFEHNQAMREQYLPAPTRAEWSAAPGTNTGDAIRAGMAVGAATRLMNGAWWCSSIKAPDDPVPRLAIMDKSYPGGCVVNRRGVRIANESQNYMGYQLEFFRRHTADDPQVPSWMVFDARFRRTYYAGPLWPSNYRPDWMMPKSYFTSGFLPRPIRPRAYLARRHRSWAPEHDCVDERVC